MKNNHRSKRYAIKQERRTLNSSLDAIKAVGNGHLYRRWGENGITQAEIREPFSLGFNPKHLELDGE